MTLAEHVYSRPCVSTAVQHHPKCKNNNAAPDCTMGGQGSAGLPVPDPPAPLLTDRGTTHPLTDRGPAHSQSHLRGLVELVQGTGPRIMPPRTGWCWSPGIPGS